MLLLAHPADPRRILNKCKTHPEMTAENEVEANGAQNGIAAFPFGQAYIGEKSLARKFIGTKYVGKGRTARPRCTAIKRVHTERNRTEGSFGYLRCAAQSSAKSESLNPVGIVFFRPRVRVERLFCVPCVPWGEVV